jgi:hypothetical protein
MLAASYKFNASSLSIDNNDEATALILKTQAISQREIPACKIEASLFIIVLIGDIVHQEAERVFHFESNSGYTISGYSGSLKSVSLRLPVYRPVNRRSIPLKLLYARP